MSTVEQTTADLSEHDQLQKEVLEMQELIKKARAQFNLLPFFKTKRRISEVEASEDIEERQKKLNRVEELEKKVDNRTDLLSRLSSYTFLYHHLPRPLSALDCAKHGWRDTKSVVEKDENICVLACDDCQNEMFVIDVDLEKVDPQKAQVIRKKYKAGLFECHKEGCIWRLDKCDDKVYYFPILPMSEGVERFKCEAQNIVSACRKNTIELPQIKHGLDDRALLKIKYFASKDDETNMESAYILSLYGWKSLNQDIPGVLCDLCFTRRSFSDSEKEKVFDAVTEHKSYCPWINANTAQAYTPMRYTSNRKEKISGSDWMKDVISMEYNLLSRREYLSLSSIHASDERYHSIKHKMLQSYDLLKEWKSTIEKIESDKQSDFSNKRKRSSRQSDNGCKTSKQSSIANFFARPKQEQAEEQVIPAIADPVKEEFEIKEDLTNEKEFYTTSMYTDEFNTMLETVLEGESFLFSEDELHAFDTYRSLSDEPQHLIVRLIMRKHGWIRASNLKYQDNISNMELAIAKLVKAGFLSMSLNDIKEASNLLSKNELKEILKEKKIAVPEATPKKMDYISALLAFASNTSTNIVTHYSENGTDNSKIEKLWNTINSYLGPCIRVNDEIYKLIQRLQIVYYRINMAVDSSAISTSILAKTSKRNYPEYTACRSTAIWNSRDDLLKYEEALLVEREYEKSIELLTVYNASKTKKFISAENGDSEIRNLMIKSWTICENRIGLWDECIAERDIEGDLVRPYYMRRFEAGWIYTRVLDHGTELLGKLHEYELEAIILQKLVDQKYYRLGKRGKWYDRLALVQSNYLSKEQPRLQKKAALKTCIEAIHDPRVHQIYLHGIHKRINRLEKDLCIPRREQHQFDYMMLKKRKEITIHGERLSDEVIGKKSVWRSDDGSECSVEQVAIEYYKKKGYKGLHCENGVVRMIAVLLFWDVIYAPIPGVFETPYQMAPLDLRSDAFYEGRIDIINDRIGEITRGLYKEIIKEVDDRERPKRTVSVGINWNYEQQDILEIAECIGASSLASLCQLYFEEFGQRQGGMPDLCCWNFEKKECLFSEVKGPGDTLSETQKLWIETLTGFNIQVEVCFVKVWKGDDLLLES